MINSFGTPSGSFLHNKDTHLCYDESNSTPRYLPQRHTNMFPRETGTSMDMPAVFIIAKSWKELDVYQQEEKEAPVYSNNGMQLAIKRHTRPTQQNGTS